MTSQRFYACRHHQTMSVSEVLAIMKEGEKKQYPLNLPPPAANWTLRARGDQMSGTETVHACIHIY